MDKIKKFVKENLQMILLVLCGLFVITGILAIVFGAANSGGVIKVLFIIFGIVLIALGCSLVFYAALIATDENANFFLYDQRSKRSISIEELDFERVNKKMTYIMTKLVANASKVWTSNLFADNREFFDDNEVFTPLVAYKVIYDLADRANESIWHLYLMADKSVIASIAEALEMNSDSDLGKAVKYLHENAAGDYERTQKFLADNKKYIQNKMTKYVKVHISKF
ncbi:MAG: hypothetical protein IKA62_05155 [Clostridia bacterium]|nr:hypothetical protein [Clostridia bacterium]